MQLNLEICTTFLFSIRFLDKLICAKAYGTGGFVKRLITHVGSQTPGEADWFYRWSLTACAHSASVFIYVTLPTLILAVISLRWHQDERSRLIRTCEDTLCKYFTQLCSMCYILDTYLLTYLLTVTMHMHLKQHQCQGSLVWRSETVEYQYPVISLTPALMISKVIHCVLCSLYTLQVLDACTYIMSKNCNLFVYSITWLKLLKCQPLWLLN